MALIVHIRPDGSLALESGATPPSSHALPVSTLERWGVTPGHDFALALGDESFAYRFSTFGRKKAKGKEVANHQVLIYEQVVDDE